LDPSVDPVAVATALVAVVQGGYVLARAAGSADTHTQAVEGILALLACRTRTGGSHDRSSGTATPCANPAWRRVLRAGRRNHPWLYSLPDREPATFFNSIE